MSPSETVMQMNDAHPRPANSIDGWAQELIDTLTDQIGPHNIVVLKSQLHALNDMPSLPKPLQPDPTKPAIVRDSDGLTALATKLAEAEIVAIDLETSDLNPRKGEIVGIGFSPKHRQQLHQTLLTLYSTSVRIRPRDQKQRTDLQVHLLDTFGYVYKCKGKELDLDDLPPGRKKINVGSKDRPVWRVQMQTENSERSERPTGIVFRLNTELATELSTPKKTIGFTLIARKVFGLFRQYRRQPAMIRLIMLTLRQTGREFRRDLRRLLGDLGFDVTHPTRAIEDLRKGLAGLQRCGLIIDFAVDADNDTVAVTRNADWYREKTTNE